MVRFQTNPQISASGNKYFFLLKDLWVAPRTPRAWLYWAPDYVEFKSLCDFSFWTNEHWGYVFVFPLVKDRISRAEQSYAVTSEPSACIMPAQISPTKTTRVSRPYVTKRGWEANICRTIQSAGTKVKRKSARTMFSDHFLVLVSPLLL